MLTQGAKTQRKTRQLSLRLCALSEHSERAFKLLTESDEDKHLRLLHPEHVPISINLTFYKTIN
jgi:hypothetical protein